MYQAFKEMPTLLKFITAHALFCFMFFMAVVIPGIPITFKGELMEFYDLWEGGLPTAAMGLSMPVVGVLLLKRWQYARTSIRFCLYPLWLPHMSIGNSCQQSYSA
ncbi:MAG: hypothetical protein ABW127_18205 [Candidatus Thiodiazotropha endolucinida]